MTKGQMQGVAGIVAFFLVLFTVLALTFKPKGDKPAGSAADSYFVQQRIKNLEKSK